MCMFVYLVLSVLVIVYRALGFGRVPPCTGRLLNMDRDIKRMADKKLLKTWFVSPGESSRMAQTQM